jgi:hypothetical protein
MTATLRLMVGPSEDMHSTTQCARIPKSAVSTARLLDQEMSGIYFRCIKIIIDMFTVRQLISKRVVQIILH